MHILRIEHQIRDFDAWKEAFDRDPVGRKQGGVRRYRVLRPVDDPNYIMVDLEFDSSSEAEAFRTALQRDVWGSPPGPTLAPWTAFFALSPSLVPGFKV
jgi:hypothetical protein